MIMNRRKFLIGVLAAPVVIRSQVLMPVRQIVNSCREILLPQGPGIFSFYYRYARDERNVLQEFIEWETHGDV